MGVRWTLGLVGLLAVAPPGAARAAPPDMCADYARSAVQQFNRMRATPGCSQRSSNLWHRTPERHYAWCATAHPAAVRRQLRIRDEVIARCDPSYGD